MVPRHPGSFHIAPGDSYEENGEHLHAYERLGVEVDSFNLSHQIHHFCLGLRFGWKKFGLDGHREIQTEQKRMKMSYYVRAVPMGLDAIRYSMDATSYSSFRGKNSNKFPGVFFYYDISPITVVYEHPRNFVGFLVEISGILGGVFSVAVFLDALAVNCIRHDDDLMKKE
jgi:hypothetical protein